MDRQIIIATYDVTEDEMKNNTCDPGKIYDKDLKLIKVRYDGKSMWVPLQKTGLTSTGDFRPQEERVLVVFPEPNYSDSGAVEAAYAIIINIPPQFISNRVEEKDIKSSSFTKMLDGTNSQLTKGQEINYGGNGIQVNIDGVSIKSPGGELRLGKEGMLSRGPTTTLNFFDDSKGGVLKQNGIAAIIPETIKVAIECLTGTPMPPYLPDKKIMDMVKNIADAVSDFKGVA